VRVVADSLPLMQVRFWVDPICPWCWLTSRWILDVAPHRGLDITWMPISLFVKNGLADQPDSPFYEAAKHTHGLLRVMESVRAAEGDAPLGALYTAMGEHIHHNRNRAVEAATVLAEVGLPVSHAAAYDDPSFDAAIAASMDEGLGLTGTDVGTPIIAFPNASGVTTAFFGPVISRRLPTAQALDLWDGMMLMGRVDSFWELKRTRTSGPTFIDE